MELTPVVAERSDLLTAIDRFHRADGELNDLTTVLEEESVQSADGRVTEEADDDAPDRAVRQPAGQPGHPGPRLRHPHRAGRARRAGALPHRRRAARDAAGAEEHPERRHLPPEDHERHRHRRAPQASGRPDVGQARRAQDRPPRGDAAHGVGREGRHANPRQRHLQPGRCSDLHLLDRNFEALPRARTPSRTG